MKAPDPLPEPGAWLVFPDGSVYEVVRPDRGGDAADPSGVHYLSVSDGEVDWAPWSDVHAVGTYESVDAIAAALAPPIPTATTTRVLLTIRHAMGAQPGPRTVSAFGELVAATLSAAGIAARVTAEAVPEEPAGYAWGWTCPGDSSEHWPRWGGLAPTWLEPGTDIECGHCGYVQTWDGTRWTDQRS